MSPDPQLWEIPYGAMGFHRDDDPGTGYQLRTLLECLCNPYQDIYDLLREREDQKGWTILFDPDNCPAKWLFYPAQVVGVRPTPDMDEAHLRAEIKQPTTWKRGQPASIRLTAQRTLPGTKRVIIRSRTPEVGHHYIRTLASETPDEERTRAVLRENVPAWEMLDYAAISGVDCEDVAAGWKTVATLSAAFTSVEDLADILPTELPEP